MLIVLYYAYIFICHKKSLFVGIKIILPFTFIDCVDICEWDSRNRAQHWIKKDWPKRASLTPGNKNIIKEALVDPLKILLPVTLN